LSRVGSNKGITVDWLASYIRNPKSVRPDARGMPAFEGDMTEAEIKAMAEWLSKKK
jgi:hypothetical protein